MILRSVSQTETEENITDYSADFSKHRSNYILVIAIFNIKFFICHVVVLSVNVYRQKFLLFSLNLPLIL